MAAETPSPRWSRQTITRNVWMVLATAGAILVVYLLVRPLKVFAPPPTGVPEHVMELQPSDIVRVYSANRITIRPDTPFSQNKLGIVEVVPEQQSFPVLKVTGSIIARSDPDEHNPEDRWQFSTADLQTLYTDWVKSEAEVQFAAKQLDKTKELHKARLAHHQTIVERMKGLVRAGTDAPRELVAAEAEYLQAELEGHQQIYENELALSQAQRERASHQRQISQAGIMPRLLRETRENIVIAVADVPEIYIPVVHVGQACRVRFYGYHASAFEAEVKAFSPSLSDERRTLRVLFEIQEPPETLIPGLFAEIELGTEERDVLLVPQDAVLHVGRSDYVLVRLDENLWEVTRVQVGLPRGRRIEVLSGLEGNQEIVGSGMILLKPFVVQALAY